MEEVDSKSRLKRLEVQKAAQPTSWAPEVIADSSGKWAGNALRFATREEAEASVRDLANRWFSVREFRTVESPDPVNYRWVDGRAQEV